MNSDEDDGRYVRIDLMQLGSRIDRATGQMFFCARWFEEDLRSELQKLEEEERNLK